MSIFSIIQSKFQRPFIAHLKGMGTIQFKADAPIERLIILTFHACVPPLSS